MSKGSRERERRENVLILEQYANDTNSPSFRFTFQFFIASIRDLSLVIDLSNRINSSKLSLAQPLSLQFLPRFDRTFQLVSSDRIIFVDI